MLWIIGLVLLVGGGFLTEVSAPVGIAVAVAGVVMLILKGYGGTAGGA